MTYLDLGLQKLRVGQNIEFGIAPSQRVQAWHNLIKCDSLPAILVFVIISQLYFAIDDEFENAIRCLLCTDRVLSILKLYAAIFVEIDWV